MPNDEIDHHIVHRQEWSDEIEWALTKTIGSLTNLVAKERTCVMNDEIEHYIRSAKDFPDEIEVNNYWNWMTIVWKWMGKPILFYIKRRIRTENNHYSGKLITFQNGVQNGHHYLKTAINMLLYIPVIMFVSTPSIYTIDGLPPRFQGQTVHWK